MSTSRHVSDDDADDDDDLDLSPPRRSPLMQVLLAAGLVVVVLGPLLAVLVLVLGGGGKPPAKATGNEQAAYVAPAPPADPNSVPQQPALESGNGSPEKGAVTGQPTTNNPGPPMATFAPPMFEPPMLLGSPGQATLAGPPTGPGTVSGTPKLPPFEPSAKDWGQPLYSWADKGGKALGVWVLPDQRSALLVLTDGVRVIDLETKKARSFAGGMRINAAAPYARGTRLLIGSSPSSGQPDGAKPTLTSWDIARGTELQAVHGVNHAVTALAVSADSSRAVFVLDDGPEDAGGSQIHLWDLVNLREANRLQSPGGAIRCLAFLPTAHDWISGAEDGTIRHWISTLPQFQGEVKGTSAVTSLGVFVESHNLVAGHEDGSIRVWSLSGGTEPKTLTPPGSFGRVQCLVLSSSQERMIVAHGAVTLKNGKQTPIKPVVRARRNDGSKPDPVGDDKQPVRALAVAPSGGWVLCAGEDQVLRIWQMPP